MSPNTLPDVADTAWFVIGIWIVADDFAANPHSAFPAIYLKSNVLIDSGNGTSSDPYILKAGA